jgi:hypothetical protein
MRHSRWAAQFVVKTLLLFPLLALSARVFVDSWSRAVLLGAMAHIAVIACLLVIAHRSRLAERQAQIERHGEVVLADDTLTFRERSKPASSVQAANMQELWYEFNLFGWQHANNWRLVYADEKGQKVLCIYEYDHLLEPLRSWCVRCLPNFDAAAFDRLSGLPGGDDDDILVWSRSGGA